MVSARFHHDAPGTGRGHGSRPASPAAGGQCGGCEGRLNLLLSWEDWQPDSWVDCLPPLLEPMGVQSIRARNAADAESVIRSHRVHIAVVDLGLPLHPVDPGDSGAGGASEPGGPRVLQLLSRLEAPPPTVVVKRDRSGREEPRHLSAALRNDAFAVVDRAGADLEQMLRILQRALQRFYEGRWPSGQGNV